MPPRQAKTKAVKPKAEPVEVLDEIPQRIPKNIFIGTPFGKISQRIGSNSGTLVLDDHRIVLKSAYNPRVKEISQPWRQMIKALKVHNWKENVSSKLAYHATRNDIPEKSFKWTVDQKSNSINNLRKLALTIEGEFPTGHCVFDDKMLQELISVISRNFVRLTSLSLSLTWLRTTTNKGFEKAIFLIAKHLPNLIWLDVNVENCQHINSEMINISTCKTSRYLPKLRGLAIRCNNALGGRGKKPQKIQILHPGFSNLTYLSLHHEWDSILKDFQQFSLKSFNKLSALNHLSLSLPLGGLCDSIEACGLLGASIGEIFNNLEKLSINLPYGFAIQGESFQTALKQMANNMPLLTALSLCCKDCQKLTPDEIKAVLSSICRNFPKLTELNLKFTELQVNFEDIRSYKAKVKRGLRLLEKLSINF